MKKSILDLGKPLGKKEQKSINGGFDSPCYDSPVSNVNCVSPWIYAPGCGWICLIEPITP